MAWFRKAKKAALDRVVAQTALPATRLVVGERVGRDHAFAPLETHFGGTPYFEEGESWPTWGKEGRPYDFLCQVNLSDCPERPDVPFDLFTVFLRWAALEEGDVLGDPCIVRTYVAPGARRSTCVARPDAIDKDDYRVRACPVRVETALTYASTLDDTLPADVHAAAAAFRDPLRAYWASLKRLGYTSFSRIGGHPYWVHDDALLDQAPTFLGQINYEINVNNCIGDAAPVFLATSSSDPMTVLSDLFQSH